MPYERNPILRTFDFTTHYSNKPSGTEVLSAADNTKEFIKQEQTSVSADNPITPNVIMHLGGIIPMILGHVEFRGEFPQLTQSDINVEMVRKLADNVTFDTDPHSTLGDDITADNHLNVLNEICTKLTLGMKNDGPLLGITTVDNDPVFVPREFELQAVLDAPKTRPNIFKRILNAIFGTFKDEIKAYNDYEKAVIEKAEFDQQAETQKDFSRLLSSQKATNKEKSSHGHGTKTDFKSLSNSNNKERVTVSDDLNKSTPNKSRDMGGM